MHSNNHTFNLIENSYIFFEKLLKTVIFYEIISIYYYKSINITHKLWTANEIITVTEAHSVQHSQSD